MTDRTDDTLFQVLRVRTVLKHLYVMVRLKNQIVGLSNTFLHFFGETTSIGDDDKGDTLGFDLVPHILTGIMRHQERCHRKIANLKCNTNLHQSFLLGGQLALYTVVMVNALMNFLRGIDRHLIVMTERSHRLDMIRMVMRNQNTMHQREVDTVFLGVLLERSDSYSYIY